MTAKNIKLKYVFLVLTCIILFNACKEKGCTDPAAINYNIAAEEDDGSCIICNSTVDTMGVISTTIIDDNWGSIHYNQTVARVYVRQLRQNFSSAECGNQNCYLLISLQNLVPEQLWVAFNIQGSGNIFFSRFNDPTVPGMSTMVIDSVPANQFSNPCGNLQSASLFLSVNNGPFYN